MAFAIFGSCFPVAEDKVEQEEQNRTSGGTPTRRSHLRSFSEMFRSNTDFSDYPRGYAETPRRSTVQVDAPINLPERPRAVRSYSSPAASRDAQRAGTPHGPTLTVHDAFLANQVLNSTSSLGNGQYSFSNGSFIRRSASQHSRRASLPGDLRATSPTPIHMHVRGAQSLGNLHIESEFLSPIMPLPPVHRPTSPTVTTFEASRESILTIPTVTSFEVGSSVTEPTQLGVSRPSSPQTVPDEIRVLEQETVASESKDAITRIKAAMEERESLERRLQELEKLISGKSAQRNHARSNSLPTRERQVVEPRRLSHSAESITRARATPTPTPTLNTVTEIEVDESEASTSPRNSIVESSQNSETLNQDDAVPPSPAYSPPVRPIARPRPQLRLQTTLRNTPPAPEAETRTPSSASRLNSAVSRIANWLFGEEEYTNYPRSPLYVNSPTSRPQHGSMQQFQLIQAHHLTPTTPRRRGPVPVPSPHPITIGYQQRYRPRNVEDVDPVPPYCEQDPNPSPGFVFFPQNGLLTPLATPLSPTGVSIASQMYVHAV